MVVNNLDAPVTAFVGRREELATIASLMRSTRLLSLTGVGGCGKSRLAAELCRRACADQPEYSPWPGGIWWLDLGSTAGETDIARICAKLLDVPIEPDRNPLTALAGRVAGNRLLLCLDTCEHILDEAASFVAGILKACPGVQVITTTREPLAVEGEQVWRVPSLTPDDARALFLDRARLVTDPVTSWRDGAEVPAICDRVDRLPLAIELAAAWTRVLSPAQLLCDLDDRFRLLTGGSRRAVARHQALQASMAWSHNLLKPAEQVIFRRLAVAMTMAWFLTGHAADGLHYLERAAGVPVDAEHWLSQRMAAASALLKVVTGRLWGTHPASRPGGPISDDVARARFLFVDAFHWFFLDHARCHDVALQAADLAERTGELFCRDFARVMAAYSLTARERHDDAVAITRQILPDCRPRADRFSSAFAIGVEQYAAMQTGNLPKSVSLGREMVATIAPLGEYFGVGTLTSNLALALVLSGELDAARRLMRPIVHSVDTAPDVDVVGFQVPMGHACLREGAWQEAARWFSRGLRRLDDAESDWTAARCVSGMVTALRERGDRERAEQVLAEGRRLLHTFDSPELQANLDEQEGFLRAGKDPARAYELQHRALATRRDAGMRTFLPDSLEILCDLVSIDRPSPQLVRVLAACTSARETAGYPRSRPDVVRHERTVERLRTALGEGFSAAWRDGIALTLDDAVDLMTRGRGPRNRPDTGWAALTRVELDVARLVVEGLTNPEIGRRLFMSRSTVKAHLSRVYAKLAVTNRAELAAIASRRQHDDTP